MVDRQWVLHVDLDAFIAAVEVLRHPELQGLPVVVGGLGDPTQRGVVATASYEARAFGVRSGMPLRVAARRCPEAVFLPAENPVYLAASERVMQTLREFAATPVVVEVIGWDEAYLGTNTEDPETLATRLQEAVLEQTGLWCSIGIGDNTLRAKMATNFGKPRGMFRLTADNWFEVMGERGAGELHGIGKKTAAKLEGFGIRTVRELAESDPDDLAASLGPTMGPYYVSLGRGLGRTQVSGQPWVRRSRSRETTYQQNLTSRPEIRSGIEVLARRLAEDLQQDGRIAMRVALKVRFAPFDTRIHAAKLASPTADPEVLTAAALRVLEQFEDERAVRLLGVRYEYVPLPDD